MIDAGYFHLHTKSDKGMSRCDRGFVCRMEDIRFNEDEGRETAGYPARGLCRISKRRNDKRRLPPEVDMFPAKQTGQISTLDGNLFTL